jgi:PAS domain S-box-containing protein
MNLNINTGTVLDRVALVCGAVSICIGGMGLAGWAFGLRALAGVRLDYIPMAPNTALIVILLGCALFSGNAWPENRTIRMAIAGVSFFCILVAGLTLIGIVTGIDLKIDYLLLTTKGMIGAVPVGRMSPVTAICILLGCTALLLLLFRKRDLSALLGTVIAMVGGVMIIGYWYGAPLLYGGTVIPVALTTAVALVVLGVGLNAAAGPESWPLSSVTGASTRARLLWGLLPVILLLVLIVNWINAVMSGPADSSIVLSSAVTGILSLLIVYVVVTYLSREIGYAIDQSEEKRKKAEGALHESEEKYRVSYELLAVSEEELRQQYSELAEKEDTIRALNQDLEKRVEERTSELRKTNEALNATETRYRRLFETAQDGILILDAGTGQIVEVNPFLIDLLGFSHEQFLGKKIWEIGIFKDIVANKDNFEELQQKEYIRYEDLPLETADGRHIDVEFVSNVYMVNDKKVIQCNIRDITDRKQAEEAKIASEIRYRRLFEAAQDGILILDSMTGQIVEVNPFLINMLGFSREQFLGKKLWEVGLFKDIAANKENFEELQRNEYIRYEDLPLETADGNHIAAEFVSNVYEVNKKKVIQCNIRNITDRKRAEEALRQKNEEMDGYFTHTLDLLCIADSGGHLRRLNKEWESALGYSLEELEGKHLLDFVHPDDMEASRSAMSELGAGKQVLQFTNRYRHKDGSYRWIEWRSFPVGNLIYASARDVTGRKKMTKQIEASLAEKETLLKEVHHRVKNNLQIIASLLNLQIRKINDPTTIEALKDCQSRVRSMALVHEHLYRGKDFAHIDLGNYIRALATVLFNSSDARQRGVQFDLGIHDIYVDTNTAIPLGLISNELITNSLKYAFKEKKDGKLSITATEDPVALTFVVADNGVGLAPDITLENQTSLGLQLVSTLTDQLNGTVVIDRTGGTKFTFTFPKPAEQKSPKKADP